ncbi:MAG: DUF4058 family protein [Cyanothece sp. SIO1E1]|nr:DUF4058 family protein [Cyanothece sp. SIO1E1]
MPLPGMDPYLEHPRSWPNFHHRLISAIAISLGPQLRPKYRVVVIEIDLLRQWSPIIQLPEPLKTHYRILVSTSAQRPQASLYAFNLADPIPAFPLPLQETESEPIVNLQSLLGDIYDQSGYDLVIDYTESPIPPLTETDSA